uniref:Uncharacterized protein n=1 Tax=Spumella elongata TaxID=89044 RepID=A0A7S3MF64_9STRA
MFETMEVVWINCVIPVLVSDEVRRVGESIIEVVQHLCTDSSVESRFFLNAPDYLFVSTNVAKQFPHLMESILVQAYQNHLPGEVSHKWQTGSIARMHRRNRRRNATVFGTILRTLQYMGMAPFLIHRMMIRFVQPFMLTGLALLWQLIVQDVIYIAVAVFCVLVILAYALYRRYVEQQQLQKSQNISPIVAQYMSSKTDDAAYYSDEELHLPSVPALVSMLDQSAHSQHSQRSSHSGRRSAKSAADVDFSDSSDADSFHQEPRRRLDTDPAVSARRPSLSSSDLSSTDLSSAAPVRRPRLASYTSEVSEAAGSVSDDSAGSSDGAETAI